MTNQKKYQPPAIIDTKPSTRDILSLVLSFIGFGRSTTSQREEDDSNRSLYSSSFSSTSTKVTSTTPTTSSSSQYTYNEDTDQSTLYYTEEESLPPTPTSSSNKCIEESAVFVPSVATPTSELPPHHHHSSSSSLYDSWAFQDWLRRLPKMALFHLVSSTAMKDPMMAYHLMECQYMDDINNTNSSNLTTSTIDPLSSSLPCDTVTHTLVKEITWIQTHTRAILHQLDHFRPNEQFAKAKDIADQLVSMIRLCGRHGADAWGGDAWLTVMVLILVAQECLDDTPAEIRQYLFYRAKMGRLLILEMNAALKNDKVYNYNNNNHGDRRRSNNAQQQQGDTQRKPQQYVARYFFSSSSSERHGNVDGWRGALEMVCHHLARLDDGWKFRNEYQQAMTLAANIPSLP